MIAISLHQPYASAIAAGLKTLETRSWAAEWRGPLAIHAAKRDTPQQRAWWMARVRSRPEFMAAFEKIGIRDWCDLPFGCVVATCELAAVFPTSEVVEGRVHTRGTPTEFFWGDFSADRYAWALHHVTPLDTPAPAKGWQNFFTWDPVSNLTKGMPPASRGKVETRV